MRKLMVLSLLAFLILLQLARADVTTDKEIYKPEETVNIQLSSEESLTDVVLEITNPNGEREAYGLSMVNNQGIWEYGYALTTYAPSGTYIINITASQGGSLVDASTPKFYFSKTFDVIAWKVDATLNQYHFSPGETMSLTVLITDKYSENLIFQVSYSILDPSGSTIKNDSFSLSSVNEGFLDNYEIPENCTSGTSTINIALTDSEGRYALKSLSFSVSSSIFSITPETIDETISGITEKTIDFENFGTYDINIQEVVISGELENIISIEDRPYVIAPNEKSTLLLRIDPTGLEEGTYSGTIEVYSDSDVKTINVNLIVEGPSGIEINFQDSTFIIWTFAIFTVVVIISITILRYRKIRKRKAEEKKKTEEKKKEDTYYKTQEEYRTEYY